MTFCAVLSLVQATSWAFRILYILVSTTLLLLFFGCLRRWWMKHNSCRDSHFPTRIRQLRVYPIWRFTDPLSAPARGPNRQSYVVFSCLSMQHRTTSIIALFHLSISWRPIKSSSSFVNLKSFADPIEQFTHKISPLITKDLVRVAKPRKEIVDDNSACCNGNVMNYTHFVMLSTITNM